MSDQEAKELLLKYETGNCTDAEKALVEKWLFQVNKESAGWSDERLAEIRQDVWQQLPQPAHKIIWWPRVAAAAILLISLSAGLYYYQHKDLPTQMLVRNDVAPGKQTATLVLANGRKITLSTAAQGQLASQSGVTISKAGNGQIVYQLNGDNSATNQINTLYTAKGETYQVRLPDGTSVWLNAASSLTYPASFASASVRKVTLTGEAYFEVAKDKAHPFEVATDKQTVTVLGTHFNINAYKDEEAVKTTLMEGSVQVAAEGRGTIKIKPGEQASLEARSINVANADIEKVIAWKEGDFIFKDEGLQTAMLRVARWYNVDVIYDASAPKTLELGGWVSRSKNISAVLKMMASTGKVHFKVEGRRITVSK